MKYVISFFIVFLCIVFLVTPKSALGAKATIKAIDLTVKEDSLYVTTLMEEAFTEKIKEAVSTGSPTQFLIYLQIKKKIMPLLSMPLINTLITYNLSYDSLKKQYQVTQSIKGKSAKSLITDDWDEIIAWVSELRRVEFPMAVIRERGADYIRIKAEMKCFRLPFPLNQVFNLVSLWNFETPWEVYWFEDILGEELMTD